MWNTPAYKENKMLSALVLPATLGVETFFARHWLQAHEMPIQTAYIITGLQTLWDFIHVVA